jgi:O-antigen ligase
MVLLVVAVSAWAVVSAHRTRVRGVPRGFPAPVSEADVPALGVNVALEQYDDGALEAALARIAGGGFVWVRQAFCWRCIERSLVSTSAESDWSGADRIVAALARHPQLRLVAVLEDDPPAPPGGRDIDRYADRFADFAAAFAERYSGQVDYYQIWDEPNLAAQWGGGPVSPSAYADLLARTSCAIRAVDPYARILLAGLAPTTETGPQNLSDVRYLERLYEAGAAPYFDIVAAKPYGFDTGPEDRRVDEAVLNFSRVLLLREVMVAHGDGGKAIWASHWGWNALPEDWDGAPSIWGQTDQATQAWRTVAALERARDEWPWAGAMILENLQPGAPHPTEPVSSTVGAGRGDPRWGFSLLAPDGSPRLVYNAVTDWARSLPDAAPVGGHPARNRWATYEGSWRVGPLGADVGRLRGDRASFRFEGTGVALTVRRGPYRAFLYVTVDGKPANALPRDDTGQAYVVLYDETSTVATVPLATRLEPAVHSVGVVVEGGEGQWPLVDWRVGAAPVQDGTVWKLAGLATAALFLMALLVREARWIDWLSPARTFLAWPEWAQTGTIVALAGVFWASAAVSWGRHLSPTGTSLLPVSCLALSLIMLPVLALLLTLRLDLGLALIAFSAPFYLVPGGMFYRALGLPEVLVVLSIVACAVRRIAHRRSTQPTGNPASAPLQPKGLSRPNLARPGSPDLGQGRGSGDPLRAILDLPSVPVHQAAGADYAVALLVLAAIVSSAAAADRLAAAFELRSVFLLPALYYGLLRVTPLDSSTRLRIVDGFVLGGLGVAVVGLGQVAVGRNLVVAEGGLARLQSVYHSPNNVGLYLGRVWPFLLTAVVAGPVRQGNRPGSAECPQREHAGRRWLYGLALGLVTLALVLSFSRGALLLALPAAILVMGYLAGGRYRGAAVVLVLMGALALIPLLRLPRFAALLDLERGTTFFRVKLWRSSLRMIQEHPLFGVGPGNFLAAYRTRYVLPAAWEEFSLEHPHSIYLDHWTRLGLIGVVAGVAAQAAFWRTLARGSKRDPVTLGVAGGMAALLAHGLVDNAIFFPDLALAFFLMMALTVGD